MLLDKAIAWFARRWAEKNLTEKNVKAALKGLVEWFSDPLIREALWRLFKFCLIGILNEIKNLRDEENPTD